MSAPISDVSRSGNSCTTSSTLPTASHDVDVATAVGATGAEVAVAGVSVEPELGAVVAVAVLVGESVAGAVPAPVGGVVVPSPPQAPSITTMTERTESELR